MSTPFDATAAVLSYVAARGTAPEDDILTALEAAEAVHHERAGVDSYDHVDGVRLLFDLVTAGRLRWRDKPGHRGDLSEPLLYSLSKREQRTRATVQQGAAS